MAKKIATFLGPNKGLSLLGTHAYGFSGIVANASSGTADSTCFDFYTGPEYIDAKVSIMSDEVGGASLYTRIEMNGETVFRLNLDSSSSGGFQFDNPFHMIIPPHTHFVLFVGANANVDFTAMIVGNIHE
jgi:hypothetical protein